MIYKQDEITGILINPHFCALAEFNELLEYLDENKWDYEFNRVER